MPEAVDKIQLPCSNFPTHVKNLRKLTKSIIGKEVDYEETLVAVRELKNFPSIPKVFPIGIPKNVLPIGISKSNFVLNQQIRYNQRGWTLRKILGPGIGSADMKNSCLLTALFSWQLKQNVEMDRPHLLTRSL